MASNSFKVKNSLVLTPKDLSTLTSPEAGDLACDINDSNKIKRYDAASASWVEVGSGGGVGGVDIFFVQDFESASLSSFTQTGLVLSQTDPLKGKVSAVLNHQAGTSPTNDQKFKQIIPVDRKFRGQSMVLRLDSKSDASQGNLVINIYDETNSANLVSSEQLQLSNDVNGRKTSVSFTIPETCASLSYTITALPESGKVSRIDDIICELSESALLETSVVTPNVTAWQGYTPTFQGFGTPTNVEFEWRQVGENVEIRGKFTLGATTGVEARVGLPAGLASAGTGIIPSLQICGHAAFNVNSTTYFSTEALIEPSVSYLTFGQQTSTTAGLAKANGNMGSLGNILSFFASVPCAGLSATSTKTIPLTQSGLVQNPDSVLKAVGNAGQAITANVTNIPFIAQSLSGDSLSWSGSVATALISGLYTFNGSVRTTAVNSGRIFSYINGVSNVSHSNNANAGVIVAFSGQVYLTAGDTLSFRLDSSLTLSNDTQAHSLTISRQSSLKQVSVSSDQKITIPTSELRMEGASTRGSTATAIVRFDTTAKLRGDAFTVESDSVLGTRITMKKAGRLSIGVSAAITNANGLVAITLNQQNLTAFPSNTFEILRSTQAYAATAVIGLSAEVNIAVGDVIRICSNSPISTYLTNALNLAFQEQDISVSVTNTLPQFSESDSSVRVDTANGYGSTGTKIRRFSNVRDNIGTDIEYVPSAINGDSFVVKSAGIYAISYDEDFTAATFFGISKNASSTSTNITFLPTAEVLALQYAATVTGQENCAWQGYLNIGDTIRPHTVGTANGTPDRCKFTISKVGKPNVTGVNVTPFVNVPQSDVESIAYLGTGAQLLDVTTEVRFPTSISTTNKGIIAVQDDSGNTRTKFTALKRCTVNVSWSASINGAGNYANVYKNGSVLQRSTALYISTGIAQVSWTGVLDVGDFLSFGSSSSVVSDATPAPVYITATALSNQILTAPETFSTDTASLRYANASEYTLSTLANAPVGTYITFTYAANTNTRTQTTLTNRPTQTDADMNVNGIQIFTRAYNAASTAAQPAAFAIQIGKGLKGISLDGYRTAGKVGSFTLDHLVISAIKLGLSFKDYNENTGILYVDAGYDRSAGSTTSFFMVDDVTTATQTSGYLVINASKSPALTGVPLLQPRIATLSDVKASNATGGPTTAGIFQTRTLNTISDPTGIVTNLNTSNSQFTLPAGTYYINAYVPAFAADMYVARLRNVTDGIDVLISNRGYNANIQDQNNQLTIAGDFTITSAKAFEIQMRVQTAQTTHGMGRGDLIDFGVPNIYTRVTITKIK